MSRATSRMFQGMGRGVAYTGEKMMDVEMEKRRESVQALRDQSLSDMRQQNALNLQAKGQENTVANQQQTHENLQERQVDADLLTQSNKVSAEDRAETRLVGKEDRLRDENEDIVADVIPAEGDDMVQDVNKYGKPVGEPRKRTQTDADRKAGRGGDGTEKESLFELLGPKGAPVKKVKMGEIRNMYFADHGKPDGQGGFTMGGDEAMKFNEYFEQVTGRPYPGMEAKKKGESTDEYDARLASVTKEVEAEIQRESNPLLPDVMDFRAGGQGGIGPETTRRVNQKMKDRGGLLDPPKDEYVPPSDAEVTAAMEKYGMTKEEVLAKHKKGK